LTEHSKFNTTSFIFLSFIFNSIHSIFKNRFFRNLISSPILTHSHVGGDVSDVLECQTRPSRDPRKNRDNPLKVTINTNNNSLRSLTFSLSHPHPISISDIPQSLPSLLLLSPILFIRFETTLAFLSRFGLV
jgi:hypothetical protein